MKTKLHGKLLALALSLGTQAFIAGALHAQRPISNLASEAYPLTDVLDDIGEPTTGVVAIARGSAHGTWIDPKFDRGMLRGRVEGLDRAGALLVARLRYGFLNQAGVLAGEIRSMRRGGDLAVLGHWEKKSSRHGEFQATLFKRVGPGAQLVAVGSMRGTFALSDIAGDDPSLVANGSSRTVAPKLDSALDAYPAKMLDAASNAPTGPAAGMFAARWVLDR